MGVHTAEKQGVKSRLAPLPMNNMFNNHINTHIAYELGVGVQYPFYQDKNKVFKLGLEYRYVDLGRATLNGFTGQTTTNHLSEHLRANVMDAALSFQF